MWWVTWSICRISFSSVDSMLWSFAASSLRDFKIALRFSSFFAFFASTREWRTWNCATDDFKSTCSVCTTSPHSETLSKWVKSVIISSYFIAITLTIQILNKSKTELQKVWDSNEFNIWMFYIQAPSAQPPFMVSYIDILIQFICILSVLPLHNLSWCLTLIF